MDDVAGLLGVEKSVVRQAVLDLMRTDELILAPAAEEAPNVLTLTKKGQNTVADLKHVVARETELPIFVDGLTRQVGVDHRP